jgi:predicted protein tyrosine phosphatase
MKILSRQALRELVKAEPKQHNAIVIYEVNNYADVADIVDNCKECVALEMDDVISDRVGSPTKEHVERALKSGFQIVACKQGISRSSAIAYLIESQISNPVDAAKILDVKKHFPNEKILKLGMEIIGDSIKAPVTEFYKQMAAHRGWKWQPHNLVTKFFKD